MTTSLLFTNIITALIAVVVTWVYIKKQTKVPLTIFGPYKSSHPISLSLAKILLENYRKQPCLDMEIEPTIKLKQPREDSKCASLSFPDLKKYMAFIEQIAEKNKLREDFYPLGLRMYFGRYPNATEWDTIDELNNVDQDYKGLLTLFYVPTYSNNGVLTDFNPHYIDDQGVPNSLELVQQFLKNSFKVQSGKSMPLPLPLPKPGTDTTLSADVTPPDGVITDNTYIDTANICLNNFNLTPPKNTISAQLLYP